MNKRKQDELKSKQVSEKLKELGVYNEIGAEFGFDAYSFIEDKRWQIRGIDIVMYNKHADPLTFIKDAIFIDEKATYFSDKHLNSYFLELTCFDHPGWFLNEDKVTTHYLVTWYNLEKEMFDIMLLDNKALMHLYLNYKESENFKSNASCFKGLEEFRKHMHIATGPSPEYSKLLVIDMELLEKYCIVWRKKINYN